MKHVCMYCVLKTRSTEASNDPPCPLRIPGCRCSIGAGPSILESYCNTEDPFMGACLQGAEHEGLMDYFKGKTGEGDVIEEQIEDDKLLEGSEYERLFREFGSEEHFLDNEHEGKESFEDNTPTLHSPQSLWPLWNGPVPGGGQDLQLHSEPQIHLQFECDDSLELVKPLISGPTSSVVAGQHERGGRIKTSVDVSQLSIAYPTYPPLLLKSPKSGKQNHPTASQRKSAKEIPTPSAYVLNSMAYHGYSPFFPRSLELTNQEIEAPNQDATLRKAPSSRRPVIGESQPQTTYNQEAGRRRAVMRRARSSEQLATKKDSRRWEEHEKALVRSLMEEVISEGTQTEERWKVISRRLCSRYSINRTWTAVKK